MRLIEQLPKFYRSSKVIQSIENAIDDTSTVLDEHVDDLMAQTFVSTATWGLELWEKYLGLQVDGEESNETRRGRIMTRLRSQGTTTKDMIKNVCLAFTRGEVEINEASKDYRFDIRFTNIVGVPSNMPYLKAAIEEIKPAHLGFDFLYKYNTYKDLSAFKYSELTAHTYSQLRNEVIQHGS